MPRTRRTYDSITKPFQVAHLQRVVTRCLEGKGLLRLSEEALRLSLGNAIRASPVGSGSHGAFRVQVMAAHPPQAIERNTHS